MARNACFCVSSQPERLSSSLRVLAKTAKRKSWSAGVTGRRHVDCLFAGIELIYRVPHDRRSLLRRCESAIRSFFAPSRYRQAGESMNSKFKLPFGFDPQLLRADLEQVADDEWVAHFNKGYFEGEWTGVALRSFDGLMSR